MFRDFPGGSVVETLPFNTGSAGSIPGLGTKIPHASWPKYQKHETEAIWKQNSTKILKIIKKNSKKKSIYILLKLLQHKIFQITESIISS